MQYICPARYRVHTGYRHPNQGRRGSRNRRKLKRDRSLRGHRSVRQTRRNCHQGILTHLDRSIRHQGRDRKVRRLDDSATCQHHQGPRHHNQPNTAHPPRTHLQKRSTRIAARPPTRPNGACARPAHHIVLSRAKALLRNHIHPQGKKRSPAYAFVLLPHDLNSFTFSWCEPS